MARRIERDHKIMNVYDSISAENLTKLLNKGYKVVSSTLLRNGEVQYIIGAEYWKEVPDSITREQMDELRNRFKKGK